MAAFDEIKHRRDNLTGRFAARVGGVQDGELTDSHVARHGADGSVSWFNQSKELHRTTGPAVETRDGMKLWYQQGVLHRTDGPARMHPDGTVEYWVAGVKFPEDEFHQIYPRTKVCAASCDEALA